jgi:hypothetical protein
VLSRLLEATADDIRVRRAEEQAPVVRGYTETRYGAKSWHCQRRVAARIEATTKGLDIQCVVTNLLRRQRRVAVRQMTAVSLPGFLADHNMQSNRTSSRWDSSPLRRSFRARRISSPASSAESVPGREYGQALGIVRVFLGQAKAQAGPPAERSFPSSRLLLNFGFR